MLLRPSRKSARQKTCGCQAAQFDSRPNPGLKASHLGPLVQPQQLLHPAADPGAFTPQSSDPNRCRPAMQSDGPVHQPAPSCSRDSPSGRAGDPGDPPLLGRARQPFGPGRRQRDPRPASPGAPSDRPGSVHSGCQAGCRRHAPWQAGPLPQGRHATAPDPRAQGGHRPSPPAQDPSASPRIQPVIRSILTSAFAPNDKGRSAHRPHAPRQSPSPPSCHRAARPRRYRRRPC